MPRTRSWIAALCGLATVIAMPHSVRAQGAARADRTRADSSSSPAPSPPPTSPAPASVKPLGGIKFSAWVFGDFQLETDSAAKLANGGSSPNKFDIGRAYLTFTGPLGDRASFRVTTDIKPGNSSFYNGWFIRLKYGFLQYDWLKPAPNGVDGFARIGMLHTVIIDHEENFWPRYLTNAAIEKFGFMSSADLGLAAHLSLPNKWGEIYADVVNGAGYENPENNKYKDLQARLTLTPLRNASSILETLAISPWASFGGNSSQFLNDPTSPITDRLGKDRYGVFVGNRDRRFTFGAEYAERKDDTESGDDAASDVITSVTGQLYDGFVLVRPLEFGDPARERNSFGVIVRYDHWKPDESADGTQEFFLGGLFWEPTRNSTVAIDYQLLQPTTGGVIGAKQKNWFVHWQLVF